MDGGAWWATVHGAAKSRTRLSDFTFTLTYTHTYDILGFPGVASHKELAYQCSRPKGWEFDPWVRKIPCRRKWQSTPVFLPGISCVQRNLAGYSPWDHKSQTLATEPPIYKMIISVFRLILKVKES